MHSVRVYIRGETMSETKGDWSAAPLRVRCGYYAVGLGLMLTTSRSRRASVFEWVCAPSSLCALGVRAVTDLNRKAETDEIARRHAKPSTRKLWTP